MVTNLLTEDNLPAYHREIAMNFTMDGPWGTWVNRWTAEENRHSIAIRDYASRTATPGSRVPSRSRRSCSNTSPTTRTCT
ncbi:Probable acyl-[acyl-carrier protein] desaturase DesA1 [Mycobacteroides abscessus subsp. abscessus]|nr:Probable acyl-[acyl-carrier protein] desaturase DesA1 [Mycobacteroides abscessus subsp. abscessus]